MDLSPTVPLRERLRRAVGAPVLVGAAVFLIALIIAVALVWMRPHRVEAASSPAQIERTVAPESRRAAASEPATADATDSAEAVVHVVGAVRRAGVFRMPRGARVEAAIEAAGGLTEEARLSGVNLARPVQDGEQILIPAQGDPSEVVAAENAAGAAAGAGAGAAGRGSGLIDLNSADAAELEELPRIGPSLAQRIVEWRAAHGRFRAVDDLTDVPGIGEKTLDGLREMARAG